ncbi:MAG: 30S ribosomal protein S6e [Candidatus Methanoperedens sp.]|nr:30S ribosomal protein S6e [Candidatus Methanoperedens sp.]MCE8425258.1 30S ribosomal protein S6e [Candidatus Methanoperedens sp.]MCE8427922.1 30S ribosomal protein S6e [Candidatus Methanoperedens sp.]
MADFRVVVSDSKTAQAYQVAITGAAANKIIGKNIGDTISGEALGLSGYTIKLTGGTDKDGFPMRPDLPGPARRKILIAGGVGYHPKADGVRKRKSMRGKEISSDIAQINAVVVEYGEKPLIEVFPPKKEGEKKEETLQVKRKR